MTALRQRMLEDLRIRNYAPATVRCYVRSIAEFAQHFNRPPDQLGAEDIRLYQLFLLNEKRVKLSSYIQAVCALRFFYQNTLHRRIDTDRIPLEVSGGTNITLLEAMACGKAVVATSAGCAGLGLRDGCGVAIRDDWKAFADTIVDLFPKAKLRSEMGSRARLVAESFSWVAIAERAYESYLTVAGIAPRSWGRPGRSTREAKRALVSLA